MTHNEFLTFFMVDKELFMTDDLPSEFQSVRCYINSYDV